MVAKAMASTVEREKNSGVNSLAPKNAVAAPTMRPAPVAGSVATAAASAVPAPEPLPRSSNLRLKKEFYDLDRDVFTKNSFDFMARFFERSLQGLEASHADFKGRFERIDPREFTASIHKDAKAVAQCTVALGAFGRATGDHVLRPSVASHEQL